MTQPQSPVATWTGVQFIAGPDTPADQQSLSGKIAYVPPEYLTNVGSGPGNPGNLGGVRGYLQAGGPTGKQWVMAGLITAAMSAAFEAIPAGGWVDPAARQRFVDMGVALLSPPYNVPGPDVINLLRTLHNAAVANHTTRPPGG